MKNLMKRIIAVTVLFMAVLVFVGSAEAWKLSAKQGYGSDVSVIECEGHSDRFTVHEQLGHWVLIHISGKPKGTLIRRETLSLYHKCETEARSQTMQQTATNFCRCMGSR